MEQKVEDKLKWIAEELGPNRKVWPLTDSKLVGIIEQLVNVCWIQKIQISELNKKVYGTDET